MPLNYAAVEKNANKYIEQSLEWLAEARRLARELNALYEQAAQELCDLRDATDRKDAAEMALAAAERLRRDNPHSRHLIAALRRKGLLTKQSSR